MMIDSQYLSYLGAAAVSLVVLGVFNLVASEINRFRRKQELAQFAEQLGLPFDNDKVRSEELVHQRYCAFKIVFDRAASTFKYLMVAHTNDLKLSLFDYGYRKGNRFNESNHVPNIFQTVLAIETPDFEFAKSFRLGNADDRDLETVKHLPRKLLNLIHAHPEYCFEGIRSIIWVYQDRKLQPVPQYPKLLQLGHDIYDALTQES